MANATEAGAMYVQLPWRHATSVSCWYADHVAIVLPGGTAPRGDTAA